MTTKQQGDDELPEKEQPKRPQQGHEIETKKSLKDFDIHHGIKTLYG